MAKNLSVHSEKRLGSPVLNNYQTLQCLVANVETYSVT